MDATIPTTWRAQPSQRRPSLLEADVKEIVAPTVIDALRRLPITLSAEFFLKYF